MNLQESLKGGIYKKVVFIKKNAMLKIIPQLWYYWKLSDLFSLYFQIFQKIQAENHRQQIKGSKSRISSETSGKCPRVGALGILQMKPPELSENI